VTLGLISVIVFRRFRAASAPSIFHLAGDESGTFGDTIH